MSVEQSCAQPDQGKISNIIRDDRLPEVGFDTQGGSSPCSSLFLQEEPLSLFAPAFAGVRSVGIGSPASYTVLF
ncbi:MAG TPA: hypothetical protein VN361_09730 [Oxalicibacterium sp.]|nr:hypothetical protein [Oxalicibacterium sp.]